MTFPARFLALGISALAGSLASPASAPAADLGAPATAAPRPVGQQCFLPRDVAGFSAPDDHTLYVRVGADKVYRLDLMVDCDNLTYRQAVGLETIPAQSWICHPDDVTVIYHDTAMPERCPVSAIRRLTAEEVAALPKRDRP